MPVVPQMIKVEMIYNSSKITKQVTEYLTEHSLTAFTKEEIKEKMADPTFGLKK